MAVSAKGKGEQRHAGQASLGCSWLGEPGLCSAEQTLVSLCTLQRTLPASRIYIANVLEKARRFCIPEACPLFQDTAFMEDEKGELWKSKEYP